MKWRVIILLTLLLSCSSQEKEKIELSVDEVKSLTFESCIVTMLVWSYQESPDEFLTQYCGKIVNLMFHGVNPYPLNPPVPHGNSI